MSKKIALAVTLFTIGISVYGYQFDRDTGPKYPVLIPPPKKLFYFGNDTLVIQPCKIQVQALMPSSYDPDTQQWVRDTLAWYLNHHVFIHDDCQQLQ